ncbi:hypothetical protein [Paenibacillus sp. DMB5]|uniref:hypothetical protein n=1 Tax=Paenibacillus sp. DMB5 TaxID=1780103 RepID=UPI001F51ABCB|nr:hypothetical protein [Paenibacillus sp. DMB5]
MPTEGAIEEMREFRYLKRRMKFRRAARPRAPKIRRLAPAAWLAAPLLAGLLLPLALVPLALVPLARGT